MGTDGGTPVDTRGIRGKAKQGSKPHPLICHAIDTVAAAEILVTILPGPRLLERLREAFAPLETPEAWVALLCGLHDLGKYSPTFQGLRPDLAKRDLTVAEANDVHHVARWYDPRARTDCHHGVLTAHHLQRILSGWGATGSTARTIAFALGGHHGIIPSHATVGQAAHAHGARGTASWDAGCESLVHQVVELMGLPNPNTRAWSQIHVSPDVATGLAGLASVSDWIASDLPTKLHARHGRRPRLLRRHCPQAGTSQDRRTRLDALDPPERHPFRESLRTRHNPIPRAAGRRDETAGPGHRCRGRPHRRRENQSSCPGRGLRPPAHSG
ncbi:CRISPR-associated endonuclease Cas3'' [Embleya sp. NPDC055610]